MAIPVFSSLAPARGGVPAALAGVRRRVVLFSVRIAVSFLSVGVGQAVAADTIDSNPRANAFGPGAIFSNAHADNDNAYDAPVPGFVGPDGEGVAHPYGTHLWDDWFPPETPGERNYVNPLFLGWAAAVVDYIPGTTVIPGWQQKERVLGPVTGLVGNVLPLGDLTEDDIAAQKTPGTLIVSFQRPIYDAPGADIVVFENGFIALDDNDLGAVGGEFFAELAYVEVSSDGNTFLRFPSISRTPSEVGAQGSIKPGNVYNLAGKHSNSYGISWGTPFDLAELRGMEGTEPGGPVDLDNIRFVKLVDIPGSGAFKDSLGNPIYDAWLTTASGGADINAIGAISQPHTYALWQEQQNTPKPEDDPATFILIGGPAQDFDGDGIPNLLEYMLALDPRVPESSAQLEFSYDPEQGLCFLSFRRDVRVSDYRLVLERSVGAAAPLQWQPVLTLGPLNAEQEGEDVVSVTSSSLLPQRSLGVLRQYDVTVSTLPYGARGAEFFRLRAEPVVQPD